MIVQVEGYDTLQIAIQGKGTPKEGRAKKLVNNPYRVRTNFVTET